MVNHDGGGAITDDRNHKKTSTYTAPNPRATISAAIVIILILVGITSLVLWLVYHPHKPRFTVVAATVYGVNTSTPPDITAIQFILITRNPNNHVSIHYDRLTAFLSYQNQPITPPLMLPPLHQRSDSTVVASPIWPVSPAVVNGLVADEVGTVSLRVVLTGNRRWKAGGIRSGGKGVYVGCDVVLVGLKRGVLGPVPLAGSSVCRVDM